MARQPAPEVNITEALQPAAQVHETYWRPAQPEPSPLHDVAKALSSLSEDLTSTMGKIDAQNAQGAKEAGETAFWSGQYPGQATTDTGAPAPSSTAIAQGYREGVLPLWGNKAAKQWEEGYQGAAGYAAGAPMQGRIMQTYEQMDESQKLNMTQEQFDAWLHNQIVNDPASASANQNKAFARGIAPQYREVYSKLTDRWTADKTKDAKIKGERAWGSALTSSLEQSSIEGKGRDGFPLAEATANVEAIRTAGFKAGMRQDEIDKIVTAAVIERATIDKDPTILTVLDGIKGPGGKSLSNDVGTQDALTKARSAIQTLKHQEAERAYTEQQRADKKAHDGSLRIITEGLAKDPNYNPDPQDIANVYRHDPTAEATFLKLRQTIADGKGFEDPAKIALMQKEIFDGGGWDVIRKGMGEIKTAATLRSLTDSVKSHEQYVQSRGDRDVTDPKIFEGQSWKRLEQVITETGRPPQIGGGSAFKEATMTPATLAALNDVRGAYIKWAAANPTKAANAIERENFITGLTQEAMKSFQAANTNPDGTPRWQPSEAITGLRDASSGSQLPQQPGPQGNAPAASPAAPSGAPAGTSPGDTNPARAGGNPPPAAPGWIKAFAAEPTAPRFEDFSKKIGADYSLDIATRAQKLGISSQQYLDTLYKNLQGAQRGMPAAAPKAAPAVPQAPVPQGPEQRSEGSPLNIPGLGNFDFASLDRGTMEQVARQVMTSIGPDGMKVPGGRLAFVPESSAFPVERASFSQPAQQLASAATDAGVDLGARIRDNPQFSGGGLAANGEPIMGSGLQQVSQKRVAQVDALPSGRIIDTVARAQGFDPSIAKAIASIESSGRPNVSTGSYHGLFQLSEAEFKKYGPNDGRSIMDPEANTIAGINSLKAKSAGFQKEFGRAPSPAELYLMHQQGEGGLRAHAAHPDRLAWESMAATGEGRQKGEAWAKKAVWGNVPSDLRGRFGSVDNITSGEFIALWVSKLQGVPFEQALALVNSKGGSTKVADSGKDI